MRSVSGHNKPPECHCGKSIDGLRDRPLPAVVSPVYDPYLPFVPITCTTFSLRAARSNGSLHVLVILPALDWSSVRCCGDRTACSGCVACCYSALLNAAAALLCMVAESCGAWVHACVRHGVPAGHGGSNGGRRTIYRDQRPRARAVPRHPDLRWVDLWPPSKPPRWSCFGGIAQKACHHSPVVVADTGRIAAVASLRAPTRIATADSPQAATCKPTARPLLTPSIAMNVRRRPTIFKSAAVKRRTKNEPRLAVPSCHGRR